MSEFLPVTTGAETAVAPAIVQPAGRKGVELAVIKKGAKDYLDFLDATKEIFYAYLYHRTGSVRMAQTLLLEIYLDVLTRSMSLVWFGTLGIRLLCDAADRALAAREMVPADLDNLYVPSFTWMSPDERHSVAAVHDALWTLPHEAQRLVILSVFVGLPNDRIASLLGVTEQKVQEELAIAKDLLFTRWQPLPSLLLKMDSLVFAPTLNISVETSMRFSVMEKYNSLRLRRYQWVFLGGLFAVLSNVVVASVLAFAVVPTSLRTVRSEVASLDALVLIHEEQSVAARRALVASLDEKKRVAAFGAARDITTLGLATAIDALSEHQTSEKQVDSVINLLKKAAVAAKPAMNVAMKHAPMLLALRSILPI
jgi:DNA-directed RNA polymerase specialized sigma24 family protein